jgi:phenylalanyl-tRNA synthetase beta chain
MKLPLSLIQSFVSIDLSPAEIGETLTLIGIEVDSLSQGPDPVFELSLTPNLGHAFSALGVARELAAALNLPLKSTHLHFPESGAGSMRVEVKSPLCHRCMGRSISGIRIAPSPDWLQKTLLAAGMNPINNVVDVTQYILLKRGQPMHAFDADKIVGHTLFVEELASAKTFLGLDGVERSIPKGTLAITNQKEPVAIAGIIGGQESAVSDTTTHLFLECAIFEPISIRKTARAIGTRTESAQRFERGVDPVGCKEALDEACHLLTQIAHAQIASPLIDLQSISLHPKTIPCRIERVNHLLGTRLSQSEIESIFHRLGFKTHPDKTHLRVEVPLFRSDLSEEIDLVEEVARIYGYNNIEKQTARCINSQIPHDPIYLFETQVRARCVALGLQEFLTADLISPKLANLAHEFSQAKIPLLKTVHSKSEEYSILRPSLLPGLLQSTKHNFDRKNLSIAAFEIGRIHFEQSELPMVALLLTGDSSTLQWSKKPTPFDFYDLKGMLETLLEGLHLPTPTFSPSCHLSFHPGRQADLKVGGQWVGSLGEVHPSLLKRLDIEERVLFAEFQLQPLLALQNSQVQMEPLPQFPASQRDWTLSIALETPLATLSSAFASLSIPLLQQVTLIDLYYPENEQKKNATYRFLYRDLSKTLSFEEADEAHAQLIEQVSKILAL